MLRHALSCAAIAALLQSPAFAQVPVVPAAPVVPVAPVAPAAAPPPANLWSFLMKTPEQKAAFRAHLCRSPIVQFIGNFLAPARALSGGLLPRVCPDPNGPKAADLMKPADSAEGAAARIKKMEAEAKARRAAVRYLGTVDCQRFPEAEGALIAGLRADTNECVRFEAALALGNGCCCTKKILDALVATVDCKKTNDPAETSPRVRAAAAVALERCLARFCDQDEPKPVEKPVVEPKPETPPEPGRAAPPLPPQELPVPARIEARRALERYRAATAPRPRETTEPPTLLPVGARQAPTLVQIAQTPQPPALAPARRGPVAPLSGRRDVWSLLMFSMR